MCLSLSDKIAKRACHYVQHLLKFCVTNKFINAMLTKLYIESVSVCYWICANILNTCILYSFHVSRAFFSHSLETQGMYGYGFFFSVSICWFLFNGLHNVDGDGDDENIFYSISPLADFITCLECADGIFCTRSSHNENLTMMKRALATMCSFSVTPLLSFLYFTFRHIRVCVCVCVCRTQKE